MGNILGNLIIISIIMFIVATVIIAISGKKLGDIYLNRKKNNISEDGFKIKKSTYILLTFLLGLLGIQHFTTKNAKKGVLILTLSVMIPLLSSFVYLSFIPVISLSIAIAMNLSDIIIAAIKIKDGANLITV